jgi:hypothetical protein
LDESKEIKSTESQDVRIAGENSVDCIFSYAEGIIHSSGTVNFTER